jgi:hypothetical protein
MAIKNGSGSGLLFAWSPAQTSVGTFSSPANTQLGSGHFPQNAPLRFNPLTFSPELPWQTVSCMGIRLRSYGEREMKNFH